MDRESPDVIEKEMEATRVSLTDKVAALETQVVGTLQNATDTVQNTVESVQNTVESVRTAVEDTMHSVKNTVSDSVSTVTDQVKSTFDFSSHVRERPWAMIGGAAAAGVVVGMLLPRNRESLGFREAPGVPMPPSPSYMAVPPQPVAAEPRQPTWLDELMAKAGQEIKRLGEEALSVAVNSLRQSIQEGVPQLIGPESPLMGRMGRETANRAM